MGNGTGIGRVRGLGSSGHGAHHWLIQRGTAIGNLVLTLWLVISLLTMPSLDYGTVAGFFSQPVAAVAMILLVISVFWHMMLGMQVLIEDYVPDHGLRFGVLLLVKFAIIAGASLAIFSVARLALAGA